MASLSKLLLAGAVPIGTPGLSHFDRILGQALGGKEVEKTAIPGPVVTFETNLAKGLTSLKVLITAQQSGSGDPSPTNVRPITGWTGCTITRQGAGGTPSQTYTTAFGDAGTVYGGTLDVLTGELTVTHRHITLNGTESWSDSGSGGNLFFRTNISATGQNIVEPGTQRICDCYVSGNVSSSTTTTDIFACENYSAYNRSQVRLRPYGITTVSALKTMLETNNVHIVFCLADAYQQTYQLTPQAVEALVGQNVVFADTGDISELKYLVKE